MVSVPSEYSTKAPPSLPNVFGSVLPNDKGERARKDNGEGKRLEAGSLRSQLEHPSSEDLKVDLGEIFRTMKSELKEKFAYASRLPDAPNPGLHIAPLGLVGLPLSERDAQCIKQIASQAPFGHGDRLVVDTRVRHTWEIEPANTITFTNPSWNRFMKSVARQACTALGAPFSSKITKCELYKLLLYEAGSHFHPHQDTKKAPGMFATIVVILPSQYSGGEVYVQHGAETDTFDFSSDGFSTSMLTWYTDIVHEVKPITSGYRLVLSYNLIQEETSGALPSAPLVDSSKLGVILHKWSKGFYKNPPLQVFYVLDHEYSQHDLQSGEDALKGKDRQLIGGLRQAASKEGVVVALATLECNIVGYPLGDEGTDYDSDESEPPMDEVTEKSTKISSLVDLQGRRLFPGKDDVDLDEKELIPARPFEDQRPDSHEYEGYMGNGPGTLEYWYHRTVIILYLEPNSHDLLLRAGGPKYAASQLGLHDSSHPSPLDLKFTNFLMSHLQPSGMEHKVNWEWAKLLFSLAQRWKDGKLWLAVASKLGLTQKRALVEGHGLECALESIGFRTLCPLLQEVIDQCPTLTAQWGVIDRISRSAESDGSRVEIPAWCDERKEQTLARLKPLVKDDVPILAYALKSKGIRFFIDVVQPQLTQHKCVFDFLIAFIQTLHAEKDVLPVPSNGEWKYNQIVEFCLNLAAGQWKLETSRSLYGLSYLPEKTEASTSCKRIEQLVGICLLTDRLGVCKALFESLINTPDGIKSKFKNYFIPLARPLRRLLETRNISLNSFPFGGFFRYLIEAYVVSVLGEKKGKMRHNVVEKVGCGCTYCRDIDEFLVSVNSTTEFRCKAKIRAHLEEQLRAGRKFVTPERLVNPPGMKLEKHSDVVAGQIWDAKRKEAMNFLLADGGIGDNAVKLIMGARYQDVLKVISGDRPYKNVTKPFASSSATSSQMPASKDITTGLGSKIERQPLIDAPARNASTNSNIVAGKKRKNFELSD